ncbi:hypothetical protein [uncultured Dokdonia sp.]|uniref:hypothetical protein n=1 Tax=uncultured Dokdonia sp. TaxID=575653 RepID=UPI00262E4C52|nr:hypothetical protein [uncultured Dokdonia sp.]
MALFRLSKKNYDCSPELFLLKLQEKLSKHTYNVSSIKDITFRKKDNYGRNILEIKPFCTIHKEEKSKNFKMLRTFLNNKTEKPSFCSKCYSERQSANSLKNPDQIKRTLSNSEDDFIRKHYSLIRATRKTNKSENQICILRCGEHGINFSQTISMIGKNRGCDECISEYRKTNHKKDEVLIQSVKEKLGYASDNFLINSFQRRSYQNKDKSTYSKIWVNLTCTSEKHVGNHNFWYYKEMINPNICPVCRGNQDSIGESIVFNILLDQDELPEQKKMLNGYRHIQPLQADFFLSIKKQKLIIEFDGEQHFKASKQWGGQEDLLKRIKRDIEKNNCAHKENTHILRIHYKQLKDIENLTKIIKDTLDYLRARNTKLIALNPDPEFQAIYEETYALVLEVLI